MDTWSDISNALGMIVHPHHAEILRQLADEDREWNTFLVVHALKNKACL